MFDPQTLRQAFPVFTSHPNLVYLDSAATAQKPRSVISALTEYYKDHTSNIARGIYPLAENATGQFEACRQTVAHFIGAPRPESIIFTAGTTASLNLAAALLRSRLNTESTIVTTASDHHSNYLPWKELATATGAQCTIVPITMSGDIDLATWRAAIQPHTEIVVLPAISNVLGIINPIAALTKIVRAEAPHAVIIVDAAQAVGHIPIDVTAWDVDMLAFSGHKLFGPTGIGVLYGRYELLTTFPPVTFGGGMVLDACAPTPLYKEVPARFEAGTPHIAGVIGLKAAIEFVERIGLAAIRAHELDLIRFTIKRLSETFGSDISIVGTHEPEKKSGIISFTLTGVHPHDVAQLLGERDICVRAGLQCAAPLHESLQLPATTRISLSLYNTEADIERLIAGLQAIRTTFTV